MTVRREIYEAHSTFYMLQMAMIYLYNWFNALTKKGYQIGGYVIMPNHVHALLPGRVLPDLSAHALMHYL